MWELKKQPKFGISSMLVAKIGSFFISNCDRNLPFLVRQYICINWKTFWSHCLTHCGRVTQICVFNTVNFGTQLAAPLLRSWVRIPPGAWIFVCCECRVLSCRGLCDELITHPEESYQLCCVVVCDLETSRIGAPYIYIYMTLEA